MQFAYKIDPKVTGSELKEIYQSVGWYEESWGCDELSKIAENSAIFVGAYNDNGKLVGMGRVISDNVSDACIQDIAILKEYQGSGIGREIVTILLNECKARGIDWVQLIATKEGKEFYKKLGFKLMDDHYPMKFDFS